MTTFTSTEAKQNFGKLTDTALTHPVNITRQGRVILEVMTPIHKEQMIQDRIKELVFKQFVQDAAEADKHFQETGLHITQAEVQDWIKSLTANPHSQLLCHK